MSIPVSKACFEAAKKVVAGGVNSPVRSFKGVQGNPLFIASAEGAYITDADGHQYIDCVGSWGPMILGHTHPAIVRAVQNQAAIALSFGAPTAGETEIAELICKLVPSVDKVRLVNSGTEASMSAVRLARGFTGRDKIIKFAGCYHGHVDSLLVKAGSGALTTGVPDSAGVPQTMTQNTLIGRFNDIGQVRTLFANQNEIAAVIVEPIAGNMGCIPPVDGFLEGLRVLCDEHGSVLIYDEVMTGFRVHPGGAQGLYRQKPDISVFGKIIGGGLPVGAFGGRADIMAMLAPEGAVYQAGTLSGNPLAVAAGLAALHELTTKDYSLLAEVTGQLADSFRAAAARHQIPIVVQHACGMLGLFFTEAPSVATYEQVLACDAERFRRFFHAMLNEGVYLPPSMFESLFLSFEHTEQVIQRLSAAADKAFAVISS